MEKICKALNCSRKSIAKGYCDTHYRQFKIYGKTQDIIILYGQARTKLYKVWSSMIQRCNNPKDRAYKNYGARGITICKRWLSFINFYEDMGKRPKGMTIERRDNAAGHSKMNCYWALRTTQARNTRLSRISTTGIKGVSWVEEVQKYQAYIGVSHKKINLGYYKTIEIAAKVRKEAELKYW